MAKLSRVMSAIEQRLNRMEEMIIYLLDEEGKARYGAAEAAPPPSRAELKASKPAEESESVEGAIASEESAEE